MKKTILFFILLPVILFSPGKSHTLETLNSNFTTGNFFVKTKSILPVSEATGNISLQTGISSLDKIIKEFEITEIKNLFNLNNGNRELYEKLGMQRIYIFSYVKREDSKTSDITDKFNADINVEYSEQNFKGRSAGEKESVLFDKLFRNKFNFAGPNDEMFYKQWYLMNSGSVEPTGSGSSAKVGADIKILEAWGIENGSDEVVVAILDSGIKDDHPDLRDRIWINKNEIPNNGIDDDNNGYIDDVKGWDFAYDDKKPYDGFGHGTNIATVIGANINNSIGFAGIDGKCRLMNCKNLNTDNSGEYSWWSKSIKYAVDNGADIINMSEGGDEYSKVLKTAIEYAIESGVLVVAAMMNKGDDRDYYPASFNGVFAVGATDTDDKRCRRFSWGGGSCWGDHIAVVAPGNKIYGLDYESDTNFDVYWSGTSQSTAIVSGIASLLLAQNKDRTDDDLMKIIKNTAKDQTGDLREDKAGWDRFYGSGRVDSYAALRYEYDDNKKKENTEKETEDNIESKTEDENDIKNEPEDTIEGSEKPSKSRKDNEPSKPDGR